MLVTRRKVKSISGFRSKIRRIVSVVKRVTKIQIFFVANLLSTSSSVEFEMTCTPAISVDAIVARNNDTQTLLEKNGYFFNVPSGEFFDLEKLTLSKNQFQLYT